MKKVLLGAIVIAAASFTSCKKDYTCTCTTEGNGSSATASTTITATKSDAEAACNSTTTSGGFTSTCAIEE